MTDQPEPPARVLVTKIGLDGHDRGSRIVAAYLRDAGMEVIYTAPWQEIQAVAVSPKLSTEEYLFEPFTAIFPKNATWEVTRHPLSLRNWIFR